MMVGKRLWIVVGAVAVWGIVAVACGGDDEPSLLQQEVPMSIAVSSPAFAEGSDIPVRYTCDGDDLSPPLDWRGLPQGTRSIVLIVDDPDAPGRTFVHWVLHSIPADVTGLAEGVPTTEATNTGARNGTNDFKRLGYRGPCPPSGGPHRYFFNLYALDAELVLESGAEKKDIVEAMEGHILAGGQLVGRYQRR